MDDTERRLKELISKELCIEEGSVLNASEFVKDFGADSLALVELMMRVEEEFDIAIPDEAAEKIVTVKQATDLVISLLVKKEEVA